MITHTRIYNTGICQPWTTRAREPEHENQKDDVITSSIKSKNTHTHTHNTTQHNMLQNKAGLGMYDDIEQAPLIKPTSKHQTVQMEENIKRED